MPQHQRAYGQPSESIGGLVALEWRVDVLERSIAQGSSGRHDEYVSISISKRNRWGEGHRELDTDDEDEQ
ncbi:hypothetical protein ST47_g2718 [Ascochyta rabiei]|uniref:Uncharacterized protein n=1 Tax=Didymella rabiei TaxID=5454 RepID=A0A163J5Y8_DIDRA|nr:hypothetical protein ST47_g2718 [Ascochyta rabiei]